MIKWAYLYISSYQRITLEPYCSMMDKIKFNFLISSLCLINWKCWSVYIFQTTLEGLFHSSFSWWSWGAFAVFCPSCPSVSISWHPGPLIIRRTDTCVCVSVCFMRVSVFVINMQKLMTQAGIKPELLSLGSIHPFSLSLSIALLLALPGHCRSSSCVHLSRPEVTVVTRRVCN